MRCQQNGVIFPECCKSGSQNTGSMGMKAVLLAYAVPLFVVLAITVALCYSGVDELVSGLAGVCGLAIWYFIVYLLRDKIARGYAFEVEKIIN